MFENKRQVVLYMEALRAEAEKHDDTLPKTDKQKRLLVGVLVQAFWSIANAKDSDKVKNGFTDTITDELSVHGVCWEILEACILRRTSKLSLEELSGNIPRRQARPIEYETFAILFDEVRRALEQSKSLCKQVMDPSALDYLVDNPTRRLKKTALNQAGNRVKGERLKNSTLVTKKREASTVTTESEDAVEENVGDIDAESAG